MANGLRNALLFGGGALVAAVAVAYGLGAFTSAPANKVAETAAPAGNSMTTKEGRMPAGSEKAAPQSTAPAKPEAAEPSAPQAGQQEAKKVDASGDKTVPAKEADVKAPSFDVVRAEGNGSIVIAGQSAPGAKVEILSGSNVLGTAKAGAEGDFAIALDDPLKPGDYQLVLRSTTSANVVAMSKETAVVSIPERENGQVLALVEAPGQPSKLITVPQPAKAASTAPAPAAPGGAKSGTSQDAGQPAAGTQTASNVASSTAGAQQQGVGNTSKQAANAGQKVASAENQPSQSATAGGSAQSVTQSATAGPPQVSVEAVEIEGNKIFIAGIASPGSTVRVYANDTVLGEAKTSPVGRFLVESIHELAVGDYIIRADMLAPDGLKVAARAAVPFTRAPGESVAAVASGEAGSGTAEKSASGAPAKEAANPAAGGTANPAAAASGEVASGTAAKGSAASNTAPAAGAPQTVASNGRTILPPLGNDISKQPPTVVSPKLEGTTGAVIIRRGDTLWQISRRVYGHGVRYSTIYLANQDQIEDPDLIWPGQIFAVPQQTDKGEAANMKALAGQATEMPKKAVE